MPRDDGFAVVKFALTAEAQKWKDLAPVMATAHAAVDGLDLYTPAFFAGTDFVSPAELTPIYAEIQEKISRYCDEARIEFEQLAAALERARQLYETSDARAEKKNTIPVFGS